MGNNFNEPYGPKWVDVIIVGHRLPADRASEIISRTDGGFCLQIFELSEYGETVRSMVGFPDSPEKNPDRLAARADIAEWRERWGGLSLHWLGNSQLLHGRGWCHHDGSIAFVGTLEDYPRANEMLEDCETLAAAFPDLAMTVAAWGDGLSILGQPLEDAPDSRWPQAMLDDLPIPTFGFLIGDGKVTVLDGKNPWLFDRFGLSNDLAVEWAVSESRRCAKARVVETAFGKRGYHPGLPDQIIQEWRERALLLGLVDSGEN